MTSLAGLIGAFRPFSKGSHSITTLALPSLSSSDFRNCLALSAIPILMSVINSSWLYTPVGWLDPWFNVAYFLHYSDPNFLNTYYKIARLSWIIPGYIIYHLFRPIVANYVLHMGTLLISIIFFYLTVSRLFGVAIAFATAVCFVMFTPFHGSGGWDYQTAPAGAYYIIAFYILTNAALTGNMALLLAAGAAYAATLHATITFINMGPLLVLHSVVVYRSAFGRFPSAKLLVSGSLYFVAGLVGLTVALGLVNASIGRDFLFFRGLTDMVVSYVADPSHNAPWWFPWSSRWFLELNAFYYLSVIAAACIICILSSIIAIVRRKYNPVALSLQIGFVVITAVWIAWQSNGQTGLQPVYYAYPIYPVMFFALAGLAATWSSKISGSAGALPVFLPVIAIVSLSVGQIGLKLAQIFGAHIEWALAFWALSFPVAFAASIGRRSVLAIGAFAFFVSNSLGSAATLNTRYAHGDPCRSAEAAFSALIDADRFLNEFVQNSDMYVWWDRTEAASSDPSCGVSLQNFGASLWSFGHQSLAEFYSGMPEPNELPSASLKTMVGSKRIAVLTTSSSSADRLIARYAEAGIDLQVEGLTRIHEPPLTIQLYVLKRR